MAGELPGNFRVSYFLEVEILYLEPGFAGRAFAMDQITVPVDLSSIVETFIAQQIEAMAANSFCLQIDVLGPRGERLFEQSAQRCHIRGGEEKMSRWFWRFDRCILWSTGTSITQDVCASGYVLPE